MTDTLDWVTGGGQVVAVLFAAWAAKSAADSASAAQHALREQSRPFVVPGTAAATLDIPERRFSLAVRNVGRGAALLLGYRIRIVGEKDKTYGRMVETYGRQAVPADAEAELDGDLVPPALHARLAAVPADARRGISVWLDYGDYAGGHLQWTVFRLVAENASADPVVQSAKYGEYTPGVDPAAWKQPPVPDR